MLSLYSHIDIYNICVFTVIRYENLTRRYTNYKKKHCMCIYNLYQEKYWFYFCAIFSITFIYLPYIIPGCASLYNIYYISFSMYLYFDKKWAYFPREFSFLFYHITYSNRYLQCWKKKPNLSNKLHFALHFTHCIVYIQHIYFTNIYIMYIKTYT